jgi:hypothetical protein
MTCGLCLRWTAIIPTITMSMLQLGQSMHMACWSRDYWVLGWWFWLWFFCFSYVSGGGGTYLFAPSRLRVRLCLFGSVIMKPCSVCFAVLVFVIIDCTVCLVVLVFFFFLYTLIFIFLYSELREATLEYCFYSVPDSFCSWRGRFWFQAAVGPYVWTTE